MEALKRVLVVDDDPVVAKSFDRVLSNKGYAVITAASGDEALKKLAAEEYDVVYTDIRMPGMDGIEVAEHIKGRKPWLPVVIVTGYGSSENLARAKAAGVDTVLHKPLSPAMIEDSAREALVARSPEIARPTEAFAEPQPAVADEESESALLVGLKTLGVAVAAPFVGLAYVVAFPLIGLGALLWAGMKALGQRTGRFGRFTKNVALFISAPFIGLAYMIAFPFVGIGILGWFGAKALLRRRGTE
jgi:CheY-like chemotaxis protein